MKKVKIFLAAAMSVLLIASCGMNNTGTNNTGTKTPANNTTNDTNLGNDVKNMGDAVSDTAGDAVNNVTNAVDELTGTNNNNNNTTSK